MRAFMLSKIEEHEQIMAQGSAETETVENLMQAEVRMFVIENREL